MDRLDHQGLSRTGQNHYPAAYIGLEIAFRHGHSRTGQVLPVGL